jgi:monoterpene epsilon-lactone hydrolase
MPSWQARLSSLAISGVVRRRSWGDERALAHRARTVFGMPSPYRWIAAAGLRRETVRAGSVRGEWLIPDNPLSGVILYVHGGGFVACSAASHRPITEALARFARCRVLSVDYRLAPEHRFPAAHDDVSDAYEWLISTGVPSSAIALAGDSAGGNLVLALAVRLRDERRPSPACVVAFSPWTDLAGTGASALSNDGRCAMFRRENLADFAAAALGTAAPTTPSASPLYADWRGLPPVLLHVGSTELLLDDACRVHERIRATGGVSRLEIYDDVPHCWQILVPFVPEATASLRDAAAFITETMLSGTRK